MELIEVVAGVIVRGDKIFIAQKPANHKQITGLWEFPGGRTDGQPHGIALKRKLEIEKFSGFEIEIGRYHGRFEHSYDGKKLIQLHPYICYHLGKREPFPIEHQSTAWTTLEWLRSYDFAHLDMQVANTLVMKGL